MMTIYIDGSAHPNPGPGGFSVVGMNDEGKVIFCHQEQRKHTTNNEMELAAALYALAMFGSEALKGTPPQVYCDSAYVVNTLTNWKNSWKRNGWKKSDKRTPENLTLIQSFDIIEEKMKYKINLIKVEGHKGILGNEIADLLATNKLTEQEVMRKYG